MGWWGTKDQDIRQAMVTFAQGCTNYTGLLGLTPAQLSQINAASQDFTSNLDSVDASKAAAKAAVSVKDETKGTVTDLLSRWTRTFSANPNIPLDVKRQLGIPDPAAPTRTTPKTPTALTALGFSDGRTRLKWNSGGNIQGTRYFIEINEGDTGWELLDVVSATSYTQYDAVVGQKASYRVIAKRRDLESGYSNVATVYDNLGEQEPTLESAA
ncbi:MAG: hypothetical protein JNM85_02885 [Chthonomonas sp.]|nr:hypothetical protein [Chthonomonas sp.]